MYTSLIKYVNKRFFKMIIVLKHVVYNKWNTKANKNACIIKLFLLFYLNLTTKKHTLFTYKLFVCLFTFKFIFDYFFRPMLFTI